MGIFGVKRASDEFFCPSTVVTDTKVEELYRILLTKH